MSLQLEAVATSPPVSGGLLIKLAFVGVCGTDLQILNGARPDIAEILGHEGVGVVVRAGDGASLRIGAAVVFNPTAQMSAGQILGHNVPGLFQQYIAVDETAVDDGLVLPASDCAPPICGALIEPLGAVIYAHELISRRVPQLRSAVVFGAGPVGLLSTLYLGALGTKVLLVHPDQKRLNTAITLKLADAHSTLVISGSPSARILAHNDSRHFDAALICTTRQGAPLALRHAAQVVRSGGCIDMIANYPETAAAPEGMTADAIRAVRAANACGVPAGGQYLDTEIAGRHVAITGHRGTSRDHLLRAMRLLQGSTSPYSRLITHVLSLHNAAGAIEALAGSQKRVLYDSDCIKAIIDLRSPQAELG